MEDDGRGVEEVEGVWRRWKGCGEESGRVAGDEGK